MKPLLKPARDPHPDILHRQLGISASTFEWRDRQEADSRRVRILQKLQALIGAGSLKSQKELGGKGDSFSIVDELENSATPEVCHGSTSFTYMPIQEQKGSFGALVFLKTLPKNIEDVVTAIDALWHEGLFTALYAYDKDDFDLQNMRMPFGISHYGIDEAQITVVKRTGVDEIDTSGNPGFLVNNDGLLVSVQWLNYWNLRAQTALFGGPPQKLPAGVELTSLANGAIRLRLGKKPGQFDDVGFHELQLETRRCLGLTE
jgi:hypothetical protein